MATIAQQLLQLATIKSNIKNAIEAKGETVGSDAFLTYATHIGNIQSGGGDNLPAFLKNELTSIELPSGMTTVPAYAFYDKSSLTSITIPTSVTSIGDSAFMKCNGITTMVIHTGVTTIGANAFNSMKNLTSITLPNTITSLGNSLLNGCSKLLSIKFPSLLTNIQGQICYSCTSLQTIDIGENVTTIGNNAFTNCFACNTIICRASTPPTVQSATFGNAASNYIGKNVSGTKTLYVPKGKSSAYNTSYWGSVLLTSTKCNFVIAELDTNGNIPT